MLGTINTILVLLVAILMGVVGAKIAGWEKDIYKKYFAFISVVLVVAIIVSFFYSQTNALTLLAILLMIVSWSYSTKFFKIKNSI